MANKLYYISALLLAISSALQGFMGYTFSINRNIHWFMCGLYGLSAVLMFFTARAIVS